MKIYKSHRFYHPDAFLNRVSLGLSQLSLGNMGFSETQCVIDPFSKTPSQDTEPEFQSFETIGFKIKCNTGYIAELIDFGITTALED